MASNGQEHARAEGSSGGGGTAAPAVGPDAVDEVATPAGEMFSPHAGEAVLTDSEDQTSTAGAAAPFPSSSEHGEPVRGDEATAVHDAIPPLLIDDAPPPGVRGQAPVGPATPVTRADAEAAIESEEPDAPSAVGAPASKERIGEAAAEARARDRGVGPVDAPKAGADVSKERSFGARKRFSDARGRASSAASDARERASSTDVKEFAHSTTSLIDSARPFFLAGCAAIFAVLGFLEGDAGTAQVFAVGSLLFVVGAAFSGEINAFLSSRSHPKGGRPEEPRDS